jgi:hypothetical protein
MIITKFNNFKVNEEFIDKVNFRFKKEEIEDFLLLLLDYGFKYGDTDDDDDDDNQPVTGSNSDRFITKGIFTNDEFVVNPHHTRFYIDNTQLSYKVNLYKRISISDTSIVMNKVLKDIESNKSKLAKVNLELFYDFTVSDDSDYNSRYSFKNKKKLILLEFVFVDKQQFDNTSLKKTLNNKKFDDFISTYLSDNNIEDDIMNHTADDGRVIIISKDKKERNRIYNVFWNMDYFVKFKKSDAKKEILANMKYIEQHNSEMFSNFTDDYSSEEQNAENLSSEFDSCLEFRIETYPSKIESDNTEIVYDTLNDIWNTLSDESNGIWSDLGYDLFDEFSTWNYGKYIILEDTNGNGKITKKQEKGIEKCIEEFEKDKANNGKEHLTVDFEISTDKLIILEVTTNS